MEENMDHSTNASLASLNPEELQVLTEVAAAMRMSAAVFLSTEVQGASAEEARAYMSGFLAHANDAQVRTIYYLTRALTEKAHR